MKAVLFCKNPYAFGILRPLMKALEENGHDHLWFVKKSLAPKFPFDDQSLTSEMKTVDLFQADAIFVPGNEVPHYLRGVKVQIFHGLAGEKKGHFRIRHYFDLYLTQGPYFTKIFQDLKAKYKNFEVVETGWPKLDVYGQALHRYEEEKRSMLARHSAKKIILYAPTFSPSLTSAPHLFEEIKKIGKDPSFLILIKFHDLMSIDLIKSYKNLAANTANILFETDNNIIKYLRLADLMISDTSSVVYEFLLLDKPVITFRNASKNIRWENIQKSTELLEKLSCNIESDPFSQERSKIASDYHPYKDGRSAQRMLDATEKYIETHGVPKKRNLPLLRRLKMYRTFGKLGT